MKIAISASSDDIGGQVNATFGRCQGFIIAEVEGSEVKSSEFVANSAVNSPGGAGIVAAQAVINQGVQAVISGNLGPNAFNVLQQAGIKFYPAFGMNIKEAIEKMAAGALKEKTSASVGPNFGMGAGRGAGRGMGRGGGFGRGRRGLQ